MILGKNLDWFALCYISCVHWQKHVVSDSCGHTVIRKLRMIGWTPDTISCDTIMTGLAVFLADLIVSHISEDDLRSWATMNRGAFVLTR